MQHAVGALVLRSGGQEQAEELPDSKSHRRDPRRARAGISSAEDRSPAVPQGAGVTVVLSLTLRAWGRLPARTTRREEYLCAGKIPFSPPPCSRARSRHRLSP